MTNIQNNIRKYRQQAIYSFIVFILLIFTIYFLRWVLVGRYWITTDNAFVNGNLVNVYSDSSGVVTDVIKEETQFTSSGDLLVKLDEQRARAALEIADGELGRASRNVRGLIATRHQMCEKIKSREASLDRVAHDLNRYRLAVTSGSISRQILQNTEDQKTSLEAEMKEAKAEFEAIDAKLIGTTAFSHPEIKAMKGKYIEAYIEYVRQRIRAPISGIIAKRKSQVGDRVKPGDLLMTIVPLDHLWVEANLWESSLKDINPGQEAIIVADVYGKSQTYHGIVEGLVPGTGSVFALLPPDNATGNFIHIVQRVPVRIGLDPKELRDRPLRPGLSTTTSINIRNSANSNHNSLTEVKSHEYRSNIFSDELSQAEKEARQIIMENLGQNDNLAKQSCNL